MLSKMKSIISAVTSKLAYVFTGFGICTVLVSFAINPIEYVIIGLIIGGMAIGFGFTFMFVSIECEGDDDEY